MVCRRWTLALFAFGAAVVLSGNKAHGGEHSRFRLRVRVVQPPLLFEADATKLDENLTASSNDDNDSVDDDHTDRDDGNADPGDLDDSADLDDPYLDADADDGPDGIGDGYDIDWTNWSWPDDVTPDVWGDAIGPFGQCGGAGYKGNETCVLSWVCAPLADAYSQCLPDEWVMMYPNSTVVVTPMPVKAPSADGSGGSNDTPGATPTPAGGTSAAATPAPLPSSSPAATAKPTSPGFQFESVPPWQQCGGRNFDYHLYATGPFPQGDTTHLRCSDGYQCDELNEWFFQCVPSHDPNSVALWSQCGGQFHQGLTNCVDGSFCKFFNDWYSQCVPAKLH